MSSLVRWMSAQGVDWFCVLDSTGEGTVLAEKESMRMVGATWQAIKGTGKKLILHASVADMQYRINCVIDMMFGINLIPTVRVALEKRALT